MKSMDISMFKSLKNKIYISIKNKPELVNLIKTSSGILKASF